ncbi:MAG: lysine--tRNA ligase [Acidobacteria bacterium]|nr:lysine--tRNA ligase [Acidobacteriota bacterium]|tara:strand:+ start:495 stop:2048 length:1554 start_codon:yes stop_codon:yes gene_type:complete
MSESRENDQLVQRRNNLTEITKLGVPIYPGAFRCTGSVLEIVTEHSETDGNTLDSDHVNLATAGRILIVRNFGKARFLVISDGLSRLQIYLRKDSLCERDFAIASLLDVGDFIGLEGRLFRTRTDELTVWVSRLEFLAKCTLPLPEKWHGLTDIETRHRQRYLDLIVNPVSRSVFETRARILREIRRFFVDRKFLEVETPMMQPVAGGALARPFVTHHNAQDMELYLRIAPELYLKRLVVGGVERVFEINRNFRNEGISKQHNPEFTMLEFYQAYSDYRELMAMTEDLLATVAREAVGSEEVTYAGETLSFRPPYRRVALRQAVCEAATKKLGKEVSEDELRARSTVALLAERLGLEPSESQGPGKITVEIFEHLCEPTFIQPTFVHDFPTEVSPLSKQMKNDPDTVERFELFVAGMELANAFSELNDPVDQKLRFQEQLRNRQGGDLEAHQMDHDYIRALEYGLPPTAGEGVGIDRLVMVMTNSPSIRDVILFPLMRSKREDSEVGTNPASEGRDD